MASLFNILVDIAANTGKLESGLRQATDKLEDFTKSVERTATRVAELAGFSIGIDALSESIRKAVDNGAELQLLAERLGTSAESLSRLQYAAKLSDVPFESLTGAIDHLHQTLGRAELGSGRAGKALANMGIDAQKLLDLPFDQQLATIADKLGGITNPSQRAARELLLFGEAGAKLDPLFRQGSAGIEQLLSEADRLGLTLDSKMTEQLKRAHEEMQRADGAWAHATTTLGAALAPALEDAAKLVERLGAGLSKFGNYLAGPQTNAEAFRAKLADLRKEYDGLNADLEAYEALQKNDLLSSPQYAKLIEITQQKIKDVAAAMNVYNQQLLKEDELAQKKQKRGTAGDVTPVNLSVTVDNQKIFTDRMTQLLDEFQRDTETATERVAADWYKMEAELKDLREEGLISQEEYSKRLAESLDKILPGADEVKSKIVIPVRDQFDEMQKLGERTAQQLERVFANFLFDPFHANARKMALDFVDALRRMASDALASQIFKLLFGEGVGGGSGNKGGQSGLGGLLGGALDKFFEGSPQGGSPGGPSTAGKLLGGLGSFGKLLGGLFGGGGGDVSGVSASDWAGAYAQIAGLPIPGLAEGGLVSAGSSYLVGEEGPELFTAASHGIITPNSELGDLGGASINMGGIHIDARGADADRVLTLVPPLVNRAVQEGQARMLQAFRRTGLPSPVRV